MGLRAHFKQNWPTWLVGAIFAAPGVYLYLLGREVRDPVFLVDPNRTEIISQARIETAPIKVLRRDGKPVTDNLYAVRFYFWNAGKRPIKAADVLETVRITLDDSGEILDAKIIGLSRAITFAQLHPHRDGQKLRVLTIAFTILERNDGFSGQIIYEGRPGASLRIAGIIEGVPDGIRNSSSPSLFAVLRYSDASQILSLALGMLTALLGILAVVTVRMRRSPPVAAGAPIPREKLIHSVWRLLRVMLLVTVVLVLTFGVGAVTLALQSGKQQAAERIVNTVPRRVLPPPEEVTAPTTR